MPQRGRLGYWGSSLQRSVCFAAGSHCASSSLDPVSKAFTSPPAAAAVWIRWRCPSKASLGVTVVRTAPAATSCDRSWVCRCMSNALQQLHHSFNFYFFTGPNSHISNGTEPHLPSEARSLACPCTAQALLVSSLCDALPAHQLPGDRSEPSPSPLGGRKHSQHSDCRTTPPYRDIRSLLVGLGVVAAIAGVPLLPAQTMKSS